VRAMQALMREDGSRLLLMSDDVWNDQPRSYLDLGFSPLEKIVFFQKDLRHLGASDISSPLPSLTFRIAELEDLDLLLALDNNSFPWLWWNSREDMEGYIQTESVSIHLAFADSVPVGYASFTMYSGWAHLDRLAVITPQQGRKYGAAQLVNAMNAMVALGATHVGLSTQENNVQSHRLYKGFGFRQTRDSMNIYGLQIAQPGETEEARA
jgi:ribosomal protein S18 acetylase RimI-like enzyme